MKCEICNKQLKNRRALSAHVQAAHGLTTEWYLARTKYNGRYPLCPVCLTPRNYRTRLGDFTKFCTKHARLACSSKHINDSNYSATELEQAERQYFSSNFQPKKHTMPFDPKWRAGLTKDTHQGIAAQSQKMTGPTNPNFIKDKPPKGPDRRNWRKGLTKHDHPGIMAQSLKIAGKNNPYHSFTEEIKDKLVASSDRTKNRLSRTEFEIRCTEIQTAKGLKVLIDYENYVNCKQLLEVVCVDCGEEQQKNLWSMNYEWSGCVACKSTSEAEKEVGDFVQSLGVDIIRQDRSIIAPRELDIYIPSHNLAIEYNGLYWHRLEATGNKKYHQEKYEACSAKGIKLIQFFEDEWRDRKDVCKSIILHALGKTPHRIHARKCLVEQTARDAAVTEFFEDNHLTGNTRYTLAFILKHEEQIVAALSFRRPFTKNKQGVIEIARFALLKEHHIPGAFSRLLKHALLVCRTLGFKTLLTYADTRLGMSGQVYAKNGFEPIGTTSSVAYWYTDYKKREGRFRYRADKSRGMTEKEVATEAGVSKIYGCVNHRYKMQL